MKNPFSHTDLEIKQKFIALAREFHQNMGDSLEKELACALLYMNVADYLAEYLVVGLTDMAKEAVGQYYLGMITLTPQKRDALNIGNSIYLLKGFDFSQKATVLEELDAVNNARKKIAHEMLKTDGRKLDQIDEAVRALVDHTEKLVEIVDQISLGLPPPTIVEKYLTPAVDAKSDIAVPEKIKKDTGAKKVA